MTTTAQCVLDPLLVNADTLPLMKDIGLSIFASACSKNRGAFVLSPPDGNTYGCLAFPSDILDIVGITHRDNNTTLTVTSVEDLLTHYKDGNLTRADTVKLLDFLVTNSYQSTPDVAVSPYACDVSGVVTLQCDQNSPKKTLDSNKIRAVTMAGVFTPALWATGGKLLTLEQASAFYTPDDFKEMKELGLNTVQIPVPTKIFSPDYKHAPAWKAQLSHTLLQIRTEGLKVILSLDPTESPAEDVAAPVQEAALFAQDYNLKHAVDTIVALTLPAPDLALLQAVTKAAPALTVWVPANAGDLMNLKNFPQAAAVALELPHSSAVADVASSTSPEDRGKLFYHENLACINRAPIEFTTCYLDMPVVLVAGFDLAIDDCHLEGISTKFMDYGQCTRFNETIDSHWWHEHRVSLAARQLFAYEQGQGWVFAAWKIYNSDPLGIIDSPAKLLAFQEVAAAGLMPSLFELEEPIPFSSKDLSLPVIGLACLNPPENDFMMGDATFAPTPSPPPDCGNGWWNYGTEQCDYWIPPTIPPTPACPVCSNDTIVVTEPVDCSEIVFADESLAAPADAGYSSAVVQAFLAGALVSALICAVLFKVIIPKCSKRGDYEQVPNGTENVAGSGYQA